MALYRRWLLIDCKEHKSFFLEFNLQYVGAVLCLELGSLDGLLDGAVPPVQFAVFV